MGIFSRFADIVNANINALLDKAEDPQKMIRLIIQEMEDTLVEVRTSLARTLADKKDLMRRVEQLTAEANEWERKAELALSKERDDLAKAALIERNKASEAADIVSGELKLLEENITRLSEEIEQLQDKLNDARARQKSLLMREATSKSRLKVKQTLNATASVNAAEKFAMFERKLTELESEVEAFDVGKNGALAEQFAELEREEEIDRQLAELKARVNKESQ